MSDETPTPADEQPADASDGGSAVATVDAPTVPVVADEVGHPAVVAERPTVLNKFVLPLVVPILVAATIVFYVLNVSRIFLATGDAVAVGWASVITVAILGGASALAASPRLRSSSLTLIIGGAFLFLMMAGLISIGAASPTKASGPTQCTPTKTKLTIQAGVGGQLLFKPTQAAAKAGCVQVTLAIVSSVHTLQFDSGAAAQAFPLLDGTQKSWAGTLPAGKYAFHCTVPGHAAAGMVGVLTVS
jgi:plastocyanin